MTSNSKFSLGEREYRHLTDAEIACLKTQACEAEDWNCVMVDPQFTTAHIYNTTFSGKVCLGRFDAFCELSTQVKKHSGISNATLHNVIVGNDCLITGVGRAISDYVIADGAVIADAGEISMKGETAFSVGLNINVLSETESRPLPIFPGLFPQLAYVLTYYSHRNAKFDQQVAAMVQSISEPYRSATGFIGAGAKVLGCKFIQNVFIANDAQLKDVSHLRESYVGERAEVGSGVYADEVIIDRDAEVVNQVSVLRSYVGPFATLEHGLLAQESAFFQGSHFAAGETCSLLAGPFSVSHHKATLMIATQTSFFNAGSGSNQSNHSYKLGPNKYGMLERGAKCGSSSYIFWPARIGAFSTVLGHHMEHFDLSRLPFSYIIDGQGKTIIVPGVALRSIGTMRDEIKWKKRSAAWGDKVAPLQNDALCPYTGGKIIAGIKDLKQLLAQDELVHWSSPIGKQCEGFMYEDCYITRKNIEHGIRLYEDALYRYLFGAWLHRATEGLSMAASDAGTGTWTDLMGGYFPQKELRTLLQEALDAPADSLFERLSQVLISDTATLAQWQWNWESKALKEVFGFDPETASADDKKKRLEDLRHRLHHYLFMLHLDADKEFNQTARMMYGIDGTEDDKNTDFEQGMGTLQTDSTCINLEKQIQAEESLIDQLLSQL